MFRNSATGNHSSSGATTALSAAMLLPAAVYFRFRMRIGGVGGIFEHARKIQGAIKRRFLPFSLLACSGLHVFHPTAQKQANTASHLGSWPTSPAGGGSQTSSNIPTWEKVLQLSCSFLYSYLRAVCFAVFSALSSSAVLPQTLLRTSSTHDAWELLLVVLVQTCRGFAKSQVKDQRSCSGKAA